MNECAYVLIRAWVLLRIGRSCRARHYCRLSRETVIQWGRRLHWKLSRHWLKGLWRRRGALIMMQGPYMSIFWYTCIIMQAVIGDTLIYISIFLLGFVFISCWQYCRMFFYLFCSLNNASLLKIYLVCPDKSPLVRVEVWRRKTIRHYLRQYRTSDACVTKPQCVKLWHDDACLYSYWL